VEDVPEEELVELESGKSQEVKEEKSEKNSSAKETATEDKKSEKKDKSEGKEKESDKKEGDSKEDKTKDKKEEKEDGTSPGASAEGDDNKPKFNPRTDIQISEAKEIKKTAKIGDEIKTKLEIPDEFGRMAAQTAKQVIIQRLREAERTTLFNEYKDKEGQVITGIVQRQEGRLVLIDLGDATAIIPPDQQIENENYNSGQRYRLYISEVRETSKGPEIVVSRTHPEIVKQLFSVEVPEIASGTVKIKALSREAGSRSKIAVVTDDESIDPIGSCVGQRGTRIQTIINELGGEKLDIIQYSDDPKKFISNALSPAKVVSVDLREEDKTALVKVKADQLSLAIGKAGQNVRLAAKLTGWKIDIKEAVAPGEKSKDGTSPEALAKGEKEKKDENKDKQDTDKKQETKSPQRRPADEAGNKETKDEAEEKDKVDAEEKSKKGEKKANGEKDEKSENKEEEKENLSPEVSRRETKGGKNDDKEKAKKPEKEKE